MMLIRGLWATRAGRRLCNLITLGRHRFAGWTDAGAIPGEPLPMAYCSRCAHEF